MKRRSIAALVVLLVMLVALFGTAAAESEGDPTATPTLTETAEVTETPEVTETATEVPTVVPTLNGPTPLEKPGAKFFTHPIVKLLSKYFDYEEVPDPNQPIDPSVTPSPEPTGTVDKNDSGLGPIGEKIAAYHEDGMGFGVLVKIFAMVKASEDACDTLNPDVKTATDPTTECTPLTAEELVDAFQGGTGMGALFKEYGKPALLGVGHVRKAVKERDQLEEQLMPTPIPDTILLDAPHGKNPVDKNAKIKLPKGKTDKGKGPHK